MLRSLLTRRLTFTNSVRPKVCPGARGFQPRVESLEERTLLTAATSVLLAAPNPVVIGQPVTLTATVVPGGPGTPSGSVMFLDGSAPLISVPLSNDQAAFTTVLAVGEHNLSAVYSGDASFSSSTSPTFTEQVNKATTVVTLHSSATPAQPGHPAGHPVTLTATVTALQSVTGTPTGTVSFFDNGRLLGVSPLNGLGVAMLMVPGLPAGSHTFSAVYGGDANFASSVTQVATPPGTTVARIFQGSRRSQPVLQVFAADGVTLRYQLPLSAPSFRSGVHFNASGDFNGDGTNDVVLISSPSPHGTLLEVFNGLTEAVLLDTFPYGRGFTGPVQVTVRANGSFADVITSAVVDGRLVRKVFTYLSPHPTKGHRVRHR